MSIKFLFSPIQTKSIVDSIIFLESRGTWGPFDDRAVDFVNELSKCLLKERVVIDYPDLVALAYWFRKSNIKRLSEFYKDSDKFYRIGRGLSLHMAPGNVDTIFVYSFFLSLLAGNTTIIRVSQKESPQLTILINLFIKLHNTRKYEASSRFIICTYAHGDDATKVISERCNMRLIWGGDDTTSLVSAVPLNPTALELRFPNRSSFSVINLQALKDLDYKALSSLAKSFYSDIKMFGQQACSSPMAVFFVGGKSFYKESDRFWSMVKEFSAKEKTEAPQIMNRIVSTASMATSDSINKIVNPVREDNIMLLSGNLNSHKTFRNEHFGDGLIVQYFISSIHKLPEYIHDKDQTLSVFGFHQDDILKFISSIKNRGVDRVVPIGQALEFSHIWDGYDLIDCMCRKIDISKIN